MDKLTLVQAMMVGLGLHLIFGDWAAVILLVLAIAALYQERKDSAV